jgi:hypothetical protein
MKRIIIVTIIVSCIALSTPLATAQEATPTETDAPTETSPTPGDQADSSTSEPPSNESALLVVDDELTVTELSYQGNELVIEFQADTFKTVSIAPQPESQEQAGSVSSRSYLVDEGTTTVRVETPGGVSLWTDQSVASGRIHFLRKPSDSIISGPYTSDDVRNAGLGGGLGVVIAVLYEAVSAKIGAAERGERVA